jgi:2-hydroxy-3-keto-5-methylthiopentenyl-1-phosphate phosphatase
MSRRKLTIPDPITDDFILNLFITSKNKLNPNYIRDKWLDENILIKQYLLNRFNDNCSNISEIIYRIKNNIENIPICKMCSNPISFRGF